MRALAMLLLVTLSAPAAAVSGARVCNAGLPGDHRAGVDDDGDSIPDSEDWCAETPAGAHVGSDGCAPGEVPVGCSKRPPQPVPKPRAVEVAPAPAPAAPAATPPAAPPAPQPEKPADGAAKIEGIVLSGVAFAVGSGKLLPEAAPTLKSVAATMKANPKLEVEVGGHTDSTGPQARNRRLSERRARAVKAFLVGEGIAESRLTAVGHGETQPVDSNDTPEGRARNRRVTFRVTRP